MRFLKELYERASKLKKTIALAEGFDRRVAEAAEKATAAKIAKIIILASENETKAKFPDINFENISFEDPLTSPKQKIYSEVLYDLRKSKGMTLEEARELIKRPLYFGAVMLKCGDIDGMVGGAVYSSADVLRSALQIIKGAPGIKTVSSCFIMVLPEKFEYSSAPAMIFSDCAVVPYPDENQLADIAAASHTSCKKLIGIEPKIAMLSFSTMGSARHESADKVIAALKLVKEKHPEFLVDGEMQLDAAIVPSVAEKKAKGSAVAGYANVLVFPNLDAGNIGYKLAQRFGGCMAIGPIMQGLDKPINDLSRGCTADDIVAAVAVTALQAE
ncbi:MAG TPA: phosphate acetyltransferase [Eubacteriales bacterium]|nr:phosphate acetyltransferase [Clostridia bacterium]HRR89206.1 phosphate acetyltransferase [Eubacteriales bacterium]HRU84272.1 phosphate acetyltransferase [Eubacteriales bacterium]